MAGMRVRFAVLAGALVLSAASSAAQRFHPELVARFENLSLSIPTPQRVVVCHGFGCNTRTEIGFGQGDRAALVKLLAHGRASPEAERRAVAQAVAWFGRRVAPEAGTAGAKGRAGTASANDPTQFDCVDSATNTTSLLLVLEQLGLLRHHRLEGMASRMRPLDIDFHWTAVLSENRGGRKWAIDSWVTDSGREPEVRLLEEWYKGD